jgi:hypothetical protein
METPAISSDVINDPQYALSTATPLASVKHFPFTFVIIKKGMSSLHNKTGFQIEIRSLGLMAYLPKNL